MLELSVDTIVQEKIELHQILQDIRARSNFGLPRLRQLGGMLNCYIYCALANRGAVEKVGDTHELNVALVRAIAESEEIEVSVPVVYLERYLKINWPGAANRQESIEIMRQHLSVPFADFCYKNGDAKPCFSIFDFTRQKNGAVAGTCKPPVLRHFNLRRALLLFEIVVKEIEFESSRAEDWGEDYKPGTEEELRKYLPKHLGAFVRNTFNVVFEGICEFNRVENTKKRQEVEVAPVPVVAPYPFRSLWLVCKEWRLRKAATAAMQDFADWVLGTSQECVPNSA